MEKERVMRSGVRFLNLLGVKDISLLTSLFRLRDTLLYLSVNGVEEFN